MPDNSFGITIHGLTEIVAAATEVGSQYTQMVERAMYVSTNKLKEAIQENITDQGITNTGTLVGSVSVIEATAEQGIVSVGELYGGAEIGRASCRERV